MKFTEIHLRSIAKVVSWRITVTCSHIINGFIVSGSLIMGLKIAGWALIINSCLFWIHERSWNWLQWNRKYQSEKLFKDGHPRTASKTITWRILVTLSNFVIPYIMTGSWGQAVIFAGAATIVNMILYYWHERIWNFFKWGKSLRHVNPG